MARYSIADTTLTALGDAVRSRVGETEIRPVPYECVVQSINATGFGEENMGGPYTIPDTGMVTQVTSYTFPGATTITVKLGGKGLHSYYTVKAASGVITDFNEFNSISNKKTLLGADFSKNGYYIETEATFTDTDSITIQDNLWQSGASRGCGYYLEIRSYDADGNLVPYFIEEEVKKTMTPERMITEISNINKPNILARGIVDRTVTKITAEDLEGITVIGASAFRDCTALEEVELPDTVTTLRDSCFAHTKVQELVLPPSVYYIDYRAFDYLNYGAHSATIKILKEDGVVLPDRSLGNTASTLTGIKEILVPGKLLSEYRSHSRWDKVPSLFKPWDEWTGELSKTASVLLFNSTEDITLSLVAFDYVPEVNITTDAPVDISNISVTTEAITFTITAQSTEGEGTITIQVTRADGCVIEKTVRAKVIAELTPSSYTVTPLETTSYTFVLNDAGYYESNNQKKSNSEALCRVDISNLQGQKVVFECINFAESNYDYGRLGKVNQEYLANAADDSYYANFKGKQSANVQEISYTDAVGDCFIYVSFKKDTSGDNDNDSLQFKVRFE